jgi:hypothetical protein
MLLADDVLIELGDDLARRRDAIEEGLRRAAAALFLLEDRLAEVDALAADIDIARALDERAYVAVAFAAERTEGVLFRGAGTTSSSAQVFSCGHVIPFGFTRQALTARRHFIATKLPTSALATRQCHHAEYLLRSTWCCSGAAASHFAAPARASMSAKFERYLNTFCRYVKVQQTHRQPPGDSNAASQTACRGGNSRHPRHSRDDRCHLR